MVGFKCNDCGSYNTVRCGNEEIPEDEGGEGEEPRRNVLLEMVRMVREMRRRHREEREEGQEREEGEERDEESGEENEPPAK